MNDINTEKACLTKESKQLQQKPPNQVDALTCQDSKPMRNQSGKVPEEPYIDLNGVLHYPAHSENTKLEVKAWLEGEHLHTQGVLPNLADAIIRLTPDNKPLQEQLLRKHVGVFTDHCWPQHVERWKDIVATIMAKDTFLPQEEAEYQAAMSLKAVAYLSYLRAGNLDDNDKNKRS